MTNRKLNESGDAMEGAGALESYPEAVESAAAAGFVHPGELIDGEKQADMVAELADLLTPMFVFISRGRLHGTMQHRAWVCLHEVRADLIGGESINKYAKRVGLTPARVYQLVEEFRAAIPAYSAANRKPAATRAKMAAAGRRRGVSHPRGGKESFSEGAGGAGSALC